MVMEYGELLGILSFGLLEVYEGLAESFGTCAAFTMAMMYLPSPANK